MAKKPHQFKEDEVMAFPWETLVRLIQQYGLDVDPEVIVKGNRRQNERRIKLAHAVVDQLSRRGMIKEKPEPVYHETFSRQQVASLLMLVISAVLVLAALTGGRFF